VGTGTIQADYLLKGKGKPGKKALIIGLNPVQSCGSARSGQHDLLDGAGAIILESVLSAEPVGILSMSRDPTPWSTATCSKWENRTTRATTTTVSFSRCKGTSSTSTRSKRAHRDQTKPGRCRLTLSQIKKVFLHQANQKMDEQITRRIYELYGEKELSTDDMYDVMPLTSPGSATARWRQFQH